MHLFIVRFDFFFILIRHVIVLNLIGAENGDKCEWGYEIGKCFNKDRSFAHVFTTQFHESTKDRHDFALNL